MTLFLDSSNIVEIKKYMSQGIIKGVTTNPTIMKKDGIKNIDDAIVNIAHAIHPYPVSVEVTTNNKEKMIPEAKYYSDISDNINIKIPLHGTTGKTNNLNIIRKLSKTGVKINVTAMMSAQQCYLASLAGATYVSLFCGRVADMGYDACNEIKKAKQLIGIQSELIGASVREVYNVVDWLIAGCDIVTVTPNILKKMIVNARTKETVAMFLDDAKQLRYKKERIK